MAKNFSSHKAETLPCSTNTQTQTSHCHSVLLFYYFESEWLLR